MSLREKTEFCSGLGEEEKDLKKITTFSFLLFAFLSFNKTMASLASWSTEPQDHGRGCMELVTFWALMGLMGFETSLHGCQSSTLQISICLLFKTNENSGRVKCFESVTFSLLSTHIHPTVSSGNWFSQKPLAAFLSSLPLALVGHQ